jgi:hypothetical protein
MKEILSFLKLGSSNKDYPVFAQFMHSDGETLSTCDQQLYIKWNYPIDFKGDINIFMLERILSNLSEYELGVKNNKIIIKGDGTKYDLPISNYNFPTLDIEPEKEIVISEELYETMKFALAFTGSDIYNNIYISGYCLVAADTKRVFFHSFDSGNIPTMLINKRIFSLLKEGVKIGVKEDKIKIQYSDGYAIGLSTKPENYPIDKINSFIKNNTQNLKLLENVALIKNAVSKVTPIFSGEKASIIHIHNDNKKCKVIAESGLNGIAESEFSSLLEDRFDIDFNTEFFKNIPFDYDVFINDNNKIICRNDEGSIIIMKGEEK